MQEEDYGPRWIYIVLLIILVVIVFAWGFRAFEGYQSGQATQTELEIRINNSRTRTAAEALATDTAE